MDPVTGLSLGRIALGVVSIAKPKLLDQALPGASGAPLVTRMFGVREIALGGVTLASRGKVRRRLVLTGVGVDAGDALTAFLAIQEGSADKRAGGSLAVVASGAVVAGLLSLGGDAKARRAERKAAKRARKELAKAA